MPSIVGPDEGGILGSMLQGRVVYLESESVWLSLAASTCLYRSTRHVLYRAFRVLCATPPLQLSLARLEWFLQCECLSCVNAILQAPT